jgi:hypothetical protein
MSFLQQSISATLVMGPFLDSTDGITAKTALTIVPSNVRVSKNGASFATKSNATNGTHLENGYYSIPFDTTDLGTLGRLTIVTSGVAGSIPVWNEYNIVNANVFTSLITSGTYLNSNTITVTDGAITSADFATDYWNKQSSLEPMVVGVSAYTNFPQVSVSAQTNHPAYPSMEVSAYTNFPQVQVSGINANAITTTSIASTVFTSATNNILSTPLTTATYNIDTVGHDVSLLPNINTNAGLSIAGVPSNFTAVSDQIVNGTRTAGNFSATWYDNGTYFQITTSGTSALDVNLTFELASVRVSQITINGRFTAGSSRYCNVFAYSYSTNAYIQVSDSLTRMINSTSDLNYTYNLLPENQSTTGQVKIRFLAGQTTPGDNLYLDQLLVKGVAAGATPDDIANAVYDKMVYTIYNGEICIDTINGFVGTDLGINGLDTHPSLTIADAITLANLLGVQRFHFKPDSSVTLTQNFDNWIFKDRALISLNNQSIHDAIFDNIESISGVAQGDDFLFERCFIHDVTLNSCHIHECELYGSFITTPDSTYILNTCIDGDDTSENTPSISIKNNVTMGIRNYYGSIKIMDMNSTGTVKIDGRGILIIDSTCTGGSITVTGFFSITNNSNGAVTIIQDARFNVSQPIGSVTAPITVSAYQNFPQVTVLTNLDKTNYSISGTKKLLDNLNDINGTAVTATSIPNVTVASNLDKTGYSIVNQVTVSAYNNFPNVTVDTNLDKTNYSISGTKKLLDNLNDINGTAVTATSIPAVTVGEVTVSAFTNFPQVTVSAINSNVTISAYTLDPQSIVDKMLAQVIDVKTFNEILIIMLSMAQGKIAKSNTQYTYYKEDNTTPLYTLDASISARDRI